MIKKLDLECVIYVSNEVECDLFVKVILPDTNENIEDKLKVVDASIYEYSTYVVAVEKRSIPLALEYKFNGNMDILKVNEFLNKINELSDFEFAVFETLVLSDKALKEDEILEIIKDEKYEYLYDNDEVLGQEHFLEKYNPSDELFDLMLKYFNFENYWSDVSKEYINSKTDSEMWVKLKK